MATRTRALAAMAIWLSVVSRGGAAAAQPAQPAPPVPPAPPPPSTTPGDAPPDAPAESTGTLRLHIISTQNTYLAMGFDVFNVETRSVVAFGKGADEATGQPAPSWDLPPGIYKIVRSGEPFETEVDFATVELRAGEVVDYALVVDPETLEFRGSGPLVGELPTGTRIAGIRLALNAGGSLTLTHRENVVGGTSGVSALWGLFANFGMVFERGSHFVSVTSDLAVALNDPAVAHVASTQDRWEASALYAYNLGNPYLGPYGRASFSTRVFPGYLFVEEDDDVLMVEIAHTDGTTETRTLGGEANQDDLRIKVAEPLSPIVLQEEVGANFKAVDLDLLLLKATIATRLGFGFRQGITSDLLIVTGDEDDSPLQLAEVDNYETLGPVLGATANVTIARWLFGTGNFGVLLPLQDTDRAGSDFGDRLLIDLAGTAGLKLPHLTRILFASFDYTFRLQKDGYIANDLQFDQTLMARVNLQLF
ncbi:MAG TPA: hypothetical protein VIG06_18095 [Kofleriaceae bacterium]|jgi:hypothetical protein